MLQGKKILIGVCGSIAAYKTAFLIRLLKKEGAGVKVIMTDSAFDFITPLTLATLSGNPVLSRFSNKETGEWHSHVESGLWADIFLIAPASANTIAKMAEGICDNLLLATYLSARCPVFIAPAMDLDMYEHPATRENLDKLTGRGNTVINAEYGELASGLVGAGRMAEPEHILAFLKKYFKKKDDFRGKKVLITAGPTYESIDPVRFIGNHSSGRMGYALAEELAGRGAGITLISGPSSLKTSNTSIKTIQVTSADEMYRECKSNYPSAHIAIFSAAVSDYRPAKTEAEKMKKSGEKLSLDLVENPDIAYECGKMKKSGQINLGFALETENEIENATLKLKKKGFDFIVLNSMKDEGAGFSANTNKIMIINDKGDKKGYPLKSKTDVAADIIDYLHDWLNK